MSVATLVPALIAANIVPWRKVSARAKVTYESVGKPGRLVADLRPPELIASSSIGKNSAGTTIAGWRSVRRIDLRATVPTCRARPALTLRLPPWAPPAPAPPAARRPRGSGPSWQGRHR